MVKHCNEPAWGTGTGVSHGRETEEVCHAPLAKWPLASKYWQAQVQAPSVPTIPSPKGIWSLTDTEIILVTVQTQVPLSLKLVLQVIDP